MNPNETVSNTGGTYMRPRRRWRTALMALVIFLAGAVVGGGLTVVTIVHRVRDALAHPEQAPQRISAHLARSLDLNDEQTQRVRQILTERQRALMALRAQMQPRVQAELELAFEQINQTLNSHQQQRWRRLFDDLTSKWMPAMPVPATGPAAPEP
jgi:DNA-binding NarL/FixJ family response regulator